MKMEYNSKSSIIVTCIMVLIPIYLGRIQELIPGLSGLYIGKIAMIISLLLLFASIKSKKDDFKIWQVDQVKYVLIIFVLMLVSIPFSMWPGGSFDALIVHFKLLLFILLVVLGINNSTDIKKMTWSYTITLFCLCAFSLVAPRVTEGRIFVSGTYDSNDLALLMAMSIPLLFYWFESQIGIKKIFIISTLILMTIVVLKTGSRGGILTLLAVIGIILYRKGFSYTAKKIPLLIIILLIAFSYTPMDLRERYSDFFAMKQDYNSTAQGGRLEIWKRGLLLMVKHPVIGTGVGTYTIADGSTHEGGKWSTAHNSFLQIGVELGIFALIAQIKLIRRALQSVRRDVDSSQTPWFARGVEVGLYGYCVGGFFLSWAYSSLFYFFIALSILHLKTTNHSSKGLPL